MSKKREPTPRSSVFQSRDFKWFSFVFVVVVVVEKSVRALHTQKNRAHRTNTHIICEARFALQN